MLKHDTSDKENHKNSLNENLYEVWLITDFYIHLIPDGILRLYEQFK